MKRRGGRRFEVSRKESQLVGTRYGDCYHLSGGGSWTYCGSRVARRVYDQDVGKIIEMLADYPARRCDRCGSLGTFQMRAIPARLRASNPDLYDEIMEDEKRALDLYRASRDSKDLWTAVLEAAEASMARMENLVDASPDEQDDAFHVLRRYNLLKLDQIEGGLSEDDLDALDHLERKVLTFSQPPRKMGGEPDSGTGDPGETSPRGGSTMATTQKPLTEQTTKELKALAESLGVSYGDARTLNKGKRPNKAAWIRAIREAQKTPKTPSAEEKEELPRVDWEPTEEDKKNAATLTRAGLLAGVPDHQIVETIREVFPDYGAWKIAVPVYRRELRKKGQLPEKD